MITLNQARTIIDGSLVRAEEIGCEPLTVAVLDTGGHLVCLSRQDDSGIVRPQIAVGKAWGALGMGLGTRELARRAEIMPALFTAISSVSQGRMVPVPGGVLIRDDGDRVAGAVGVSGDTSERDEDCAVAGIIGAGLKADTGG